jgi:hypothetical protein
MASSGFQEARERGKSWWWSDLLSGEYSQTTFHPASTPESFGLNVHIGEWCERDDRASSWNTSPENGDDRMSEVVIHSLGGKYGWAVTRREKEDSERYDVGLNGNMVAVCLSWNEAYKAVEEFLNEAEKAREVLLELAVYNRASEPDSAPTGAKKGKKK